MKNLAFAAVAALFGAGCASIRTTDVFHGVHVENGEEPLVSVEVENSGWKIFRCLSLASGNPARPNANSCRWFADTVTLQNNLNMLDQEMKRRGATRFVNLTSRHSEESFLFVLLTRRACHTSVVLLKDRPAPQPAIPEKSAK